MSVADEPETDFWSYSFSLYRTDAVEAACLALQDGWGLDVNCLLFCCWIAHAGYGRLNAQELGQMIAFSGAWNGSVVAPLRSVRRQLKAFARDMSGDHIEELRQCVKDVELEAEGFEQSVLAGLITRPPSAMPSRGDAQRNLDAYVGKLSAGLDAAGRAHIAGILDAAFPAA